MNELTVRGAQSFMGKEIPVVLGGFGPDKRCVSDKTVAEIHGQPEREIRRRITENRKRFQEDVDFIDLAQRVGESHTLELLKSLGYSKQSITQAEHLYILSERGYAKLIKIMDTDLAWEIHDRLMDEYFELRDGGAVKRPYIDQDTRAEAMRLNAKRRIAKDLEKLYEAVGVKPEYQILAMQDYYGKDGPRLPAAALKGSVTVTYDKGAIAEKVGVYSKSGKPHAQVVGAVIRQLGVAPEETVEVPYMNNGHDGFDTQYTESVLKKVQGWFRCNGNPAAAVLGGKNYRMVYRPGKGENAG